MKKRVLIYLTVLLTGFSFGAINYQLIVEKPHRNYYKIRIETEVTDKGGADFSMPAWSPGGYHIENWSKNVVGFSARSIDGQELPSRKTDKQTWHIKAGKGTKVIVEYRVYAWSLGNPYYAHLEKDFGYFNGSLVFMYYKGRKTEPVRLKIVVPEGWQVHSAMPVQISNSEFEAPDYDTFIDSPAFLGNLSKFSFEAGGKLHHFVMNAGFDYNQQQITKDLARMIEWYRKMMGELPYEEYTFFVRVSDPGRGGIEHLYSNVSCVKPAALSGDLSSRAYFGGLLMLESHEYFHLFNVKRIRPTGLGPFDYTKEVYTPMLWVSEGFTSYYTHRPLSRAGIINEKDVFRSWSRYVNSLYDNSALYLKPLSQYSFDAWLKSDIPDYTFRVYYVKGAMVAMLLDIDMRLKSNHKKTMDGFFKYLYEFNYKSGHTFDMQTFQDMLYAYSQIDYSEFFRKYINGTEPLPLTDYLAKAGLELSAEKELPFIGLKLDLESTPYLKVIYVYPDSPADLLEIGRGDEIVSLNGKAVNGDNWGNLAAKLNINDTIELQWFHNDRLNKGQATINKKRKSLFKIKEADEQTEQQAEFLKKWLSAESY